MKILIIGQPRSGSTVLMRALAKIYKCQTISEPWTENRIKGKLPLDFYLPKRVVVKTMSTQYPNDYKDSIFAHLTLIKKFDYTVLICRKNQKEQVDSLSYAIRNFKTPGEWHQPYIFEEETNKNLLEQYNLNYKYGLNNLFNLANKINKKVICYEDLFSGDENKVFQCLKNIGIDINYNKIKKFIDPKKKYRTLLSKKSSI